MKGGGTVVMRATTAPMLLEQRPPCDDCSEANTSTRKEALGDKAYKERHSGPR